MNRTILKYKSHGEEVEYLTEILQERGYIEDIYNFFTEEVVVAVKLFQSANIDKKGRPLKIDGIVGPLTWWALENDLPDELINEIDIKNSNEEYKISSLDGSERGVSALLIAIDEMSDGAKEIGGNNFGLFVEKYLNGIIAPPANWCAAFVSWCFMKSGYAMPFEYSLGAKNIYQQFVERNWIYDHNEYLPLPGDLIFWWRVAPNSWQGHIGFVYEYSDGIVTTIEGNKGSFPAPVRTFDYTLDSIQKLIGFGRVDF